MVKNVLLNKLRSRVETTLRRLGYVLSTTGLTPNTLTLTSLIVASTGLILVYVYGSGTILSLTILISGFIDTLDGVLARLQGKTTLRGAFLDSFTDRICEIFFSISFMALGIEPLLVLTYISSSMLISYIRARGESLGLRLSGVGVMERAERLISMAITALILDLNYELALYFFIAITTLTIITVIERFIYVWRNLG